MVTSYMCSCSTEADTKLVLSWQSKREEPVRGNLGFTPRILLLVSSDQSRKRAVKSYKMQKKAPRPAFPSAPSITLDPLRTAELKKRQLWLYLGLRLLRNYI